MAEGEEPSRVVPLRPRALREEHAAPGQARTQTARETRSTLGSRAGRGFQGGPVNGAQTGSGSQSPHAIQSTHAIQSSPIIQSGSGQTAKPAIVTFHRTELALILKVYGRMVAAGEWRDYAIDHGRDEAVFSIYRRMGEVPMYRVTKTPKLARRQGAYAVVSAQGMMLKRGQELEAVLRVFERKRHLSVVGD